MEGLRTSVPPTDQTPECDPIAEMSGIPGLQYVDSVSVNVNPKQLSYPRPSKMLL